MHPRRSGLPGIVATFVPLALVVTLAVAVGTSPAWAQSGPPPAPTDLAAAVTPHADGSYELAVAWTPVPQAAEYRVALTAAGATLAQATVAAPAWPLTVTAAPGDASLSVRAVVRHQPGVTATLPVRLDDVSAPDGAYSSAWDEVAGTATITEDALSDNAGTAGITRTVDWADGTPPQLWPADAPVVHPYGASGRRFEPTVTLEDAAGNTRVVSVPAVTTHDAEPPTGSFSLGTTTGWARLTSVTLTQSDLADGSTPVGLITRTVDWGDGVTSAWVEGTTLAHVYATAGSFAPTVTLTDEAGNAAVVATSQVVVTADDAGPEVRLALPAARDSVRAWTTLRGTATDLQAGVDTVQVRAVERRGDAWYAYDAATRTWRRAATETRALARTTPVGSTADGTHRWAATLVGLRPGTLVYEVVATDLVGNASPRVTHRAVLTRR